MALLNTFKLAGSAMSAQSQRLNAISSNIANVETVAGSEQDVYQARKVVFEAELEKAKTRDSAALAKNVKIRDILAVDSEAKKIYEPEHPLADEDGYIYMPNVDLNEEMVDMVSSARSYQTNAEVMNTTKQLMLKTLNMGQE